MQGALSDGPSFRRARFLLLLLGRLVTLLAFAADLLLKEEPVVDCGRLHVFGRRLLRLLACGSFALRLLLDAGARLGNSLRLHRRNYIVWCQLGRRRAVERHFAQSELYLFLHLI